MSQLLHQGQVLKTQITGRICVVMDQLGDGSQGEVYKVEMDGEVYAIKWYFPYYLAEDPGVGKRIAQAIDFGSPSDKFVWPLDLVAAEGVKGFGYLMALFKPGYRNITALVTRQIDPTFRSVITAAFELCHAYFQLHAKGLCYRDISFTNCILDPDTGDVQIADNDNVDVDKSEVGGVLGTQRFMAPEIVRGAAWPSRTTDLHSLAVLLFYMLFIHHPLDGCLENAIHSLDAPAMRKLYGTDPVFIFDPDNPSNRPVPGVQSNPLIYWPIYPNDVRKLFTRAFTDGLRDPDHGRVQEGEWRQAFAALRDSIFYCQVCGVENFYDQTCLSNNGHSLHCWSCGGLLQLPARLRLDRNILMLNHDTRVYPHHVDAMRWWDFSTSVGEVSTHPRDPRVLGLKNTGSSKWVIVRGDGTMQDLEPGRSVGLTNGLRVNFGTAEGEVRI